MANTHEQKENIEQRTSDTLNPVIPNVRDLVAHIKLEAEHFGWKFEEQTITKIVKEYHQTRQQYDETWKQLGQRPTGNTLHEIYKKGRENISGLTISFSHARYLDKVFFHTYKNTLWAEAHGYPIEGQMFDPSWDKQGEMIKATSVGMLTFGIE